MKKYKLIHLIITEKCNLGCEHCLADSGNVLPDELNTDEMIEVVQQLNKIDYKDIHIEGGEPFLRLDLPLILNEFKTLENMTIITNGTIPYNEKFKVLREKNIDSVMFSLDNFARPKHAQYKNIIPNLKTYQKAGVNVKIRTTLTKNNIDFMEEIITIAIDLGIETIRFGTFKALGRGKKDEMREKYEFNEEAYKKLLIKTKEMIEKYGNQIKIKLSTPASTVNEENNYKICKLAEEVTLKKHSKTLECFAFTGQLNIFSNGDVTPCVESKDQVVLGNTRKETLEQISIKKDLFSKKHKCSHGHLLVSSDQKTFDMQ